MTPRQFRESQRLSESTVATAMGLGLGTLQLLEATPVSAWTVSDLAQHAAACGRVVEINYVDADGAAAKLEIT